MGCTGTKYHDSMSGSTRSLLALFLHFHSTSTHKGFIQGYAYLQAFFFLDIPLQEHVEKNNNKITRTYQLL